MIIVLNIETIHTTIVFFEGEEKFLPTLLLPTFLSVSYHFLNLICGPRKGHKLV